MSENDIFVELMASVQEMDAIVKGQTQPTRRFEFPEPEGDERWQSSNLRVQRFVVARWQLY